VLRNLKRPCFAWPFYLPFDYPNAHITLFEIQDGLAKLADKNIVLNSLQDRVRAIRCDIKEIKTCFSSLGDNYFDLVVSNPPFRRLKSGRMSEGEEKAIARHELKLSCVPLEGKRQGMHGLPPPTALGTD